MLTVKQILDTKGRSVYSAKRSTTIREALKILADHEIGALLVTDEGDKPVGILSERDVVRRLAEREHCDLDLPINDLMTSPILYVGLGYTLDECMALMTHKHIRHLPVIEEGSLIGMISIGDVVKAEIQDRDMLISHLEQYIAGTGYGH
jgi:CBS domain-containing protein